MKVSNMTSPRSGKPVANQYLIEGEHKGQKGQFFQSYKSVIAFKPANGSSITLDVNYWDWSVGKYRNEFLGEGIAETRKKIKAGEYILEDLNQ